MPIRYTPNGAGDEEKRKPRSNKRKNPAAKKTKEPEPRPADRGPVVPPPGKTRMVILIDDETLEAIRERAGRDGRGYQAVIDESLRQYLGKSSVPVDSDNLRRILREELRRAAKD